MRNFCWRSLVFVALVASSCAAPPQYDETANSQLTNLQHEVDSQIVEFISLSHQTDPTSVKMGSYAQNIGWYNKVDADLMSLELRMEAVTDPSTANLPELFDTIRGQLKNIEADHQKKGNLNGIVWTAVRSQLNAPFAVLMTYELSLKGVPSAASASTKSTATANAAKTVVPGASQ